MWPPARCSLLLLLLAFVLLAAAKEWSIKIDAPSDELSLSAGRDARIKCNVHGLAPGERASIKWKSDSGVPRTGGLLLWRDPTVQDSGTYTCTVNVDGEEESKSIEVAFVEFAKFLDFPRDQHPEVGTEARIVCNVSKPEQAELFWTVDNKQVVRDERIDFADDNTVLIVKNFTSSDNNVYTCNIPQEFNGIASTEINVTAYVRPEILNAEFPTTAINEGKDAVFVCQYSGVPKPRLQWMRTTQSHRPENVSASEKYVISEKEWSSVLKIRNVSDVDVGTYACRIESVIGSQEKSHLLKVNTKPRIVKSANYYANLGESVEVPCVASGAGVHLEWFADDARVPPLDARDDTQRFGYVLNDTGSVLVYRKVSENDETKFLCVAKNEAGSDEWNVRIDLTRAPVITAHPPSTVRVIHGNPFSLSCEGDGVPNVELVWHHNKAAIEGVNDLFFVNVSEIGKAVLDVKASPRGAGTYFCSANNTLGRVESPPTEVLLIEPPRLPDVLCGNQSLPNRAYCYVDFSSVPQNRLPTRYSVELLPSEGALLQAPIELEVVFGGNRINIRPLNTSTEYRARFKAHNEAGTSEWSEHKTFSTTNAWAPESVTEIVSNCDSTDCSFSWDSADDNGSPITNYKILVSQPNSTEEEGFETPAFVGTTHENHLSIASLPPNAQYKMRVVAANEVGESDAAEADFFVGGKVRTSTMLVFALIALVLLLIAIGVVVIVVTKCRRQFSDKTGIPNGAAIEEGENLVPGSSTTPTTKRVVRA